MLGEEGREVIDAQAGGAEDVPGYSYGVSIGGKLRNRTVIAVVGFRWRR